MKLRSMRDLERSGATVLNTAPFLVDCAPPFLAVRFFESHRTLGWSLLHPGFSTVSDVVWVEVRDKDLPPEVDPRSFLQDRLAKAGMSNALAFMTSRNVARHHFGRRRVEEVEAFCLVTVGLSNGERIGTRKSVRGRIGTVNILACLSCPLTDGALVEALSIAVQARTAAIIETRPPELGPAITGTGTDCIVIAAPFTGVSLEYAGLHTAVGEAIGGAVYDAMREGAEAWNVEYLGLPPGT